MKKYQYIAQKYGNANKTLISFTASAKDIYKWAGIPTCNDRFRGIQRALSARHEKITEFFDQGELSPTSIVVAFGENRTVLDDLGMPNSWPNETLTSRPEFTHLEFNIEDIDLENISVVELAEKVALSLETRLRDGNPEFNPNDVLDDEEGDDLMPEGDEEEQNDEDDSIDISIDIGGKKLEGFYKFLKSPDKINIWIQEQETKYNELKEREAGGERLGKKEKEFIEYPPKHVFKTSLSHLLRPAMIIDGQHRIHGAVNAQNNTTFNVVALMDTDWVDQVFQFIVLNRTAKPITKDFFRALCNTSLTNKEIGNIDDRLKVIGISNDDRIIMRTIAYNPKSPFYNLVGEAGEIEGSDDSDKLPGIGMVSLAKKFYKLAKVDSKSQFPPETFNKAFPDDLKLYNKENPRRPRKELTNTATKACWKNVWHEYFFAFWDVMRNKYEPENIWQKADKNNLFKIVTLKALQDYFISVKVKAKSNYTSVEDFRSDVEDFFEDLKSTFFLGWTATGLQSGNGPQEIQNAIESALDGTTMNKLQNESYLWTAN